MATLADVIDATAANLVVTFESNVLPPVTLFDGKDTSGPGVGANIAGLLGIKGGVVIRNASGGVIASVGNPSQFSALRAALLGLGLVGAVIVLVLAIRAARR